MISPLIQRIIDTMKRNETQAALVDINRNLKSKKDKLNENEKVQLQLLKGTILIQLGQPGEAELNLRQLFQPNLDKGLYFLYNNLAKELDLLGEFINLVSQPKNIEEMKDLYQMQICNHSFEEASKIALKLLKEQTSNEQYLEYIVLISQQENRGGKMAEIFLNKVQTNLKTGTDLHKQLVKLQMKYYQKNNVLDKVVELLKNNEEIFKEYQQNCAISLWLYQQDEQYYQIMLEYHNIVFKSHLDEDNFIINFECQAQMINHFKSTQKQLEIFEIPIQQPFQLVPKEQLLNHIYNSCLLVIQQVKSPLILKSLIFSALIICNQNTTKIIDKFYSIQGDKYSFCSELFKIIDNPNQVAEIILKSDHQFKSKEAQTISQINLTKIKPLPKEDLLKLYHSYPVPIQVEKGDRLIQDDYLMMAVDSLYDVNDYEKCVQALVLLKMGLRNSPYNYDFLLRQILLLSNLGLVEQCIEQLTVLDIKGVQFDTIGFSFAKAFLEFGGPTFSVEKKNNLALSFYLESLRESKKNLMKAFKMKNYEPFEQFYQFEQWIKKSYLKAIYYFVQATILKEQNKQEINIQWYLNQILRSKSFTYSIDENQFQNYQIKELNQKIPKFNNFLGIYQDPNQLMFDAKVYELLNSPNQELINQMRQNNLEQIQIEYRNSLKGFENQSNNYLKDYLKLIEFERHFILEVAQLEVNMGQQQLQQLEMDFFSFAPITEIFMNLKLSKIPVDAIRMIHRFLQYTFPFVRLLSRNACEHKKKLFKLSQKGKGEQKGYFDKLSKQVGGFGADVRENTLEFGRKLMEELNFKYNLEDGELSQQFDFLNISMRTRIEDALKELKKVREDMRMEILFNKKPLKNLKLYELTEDEVNIDLEKVTLWSPDNSQIYCQIKENGFADFICNRENLLDTYETLILDAEDITIMDSQLFNFKLKFLRLNHNLIECVQHLPNSLIELHLFNNPINQLNLMKHNLQYLGLGYCKLNDEAIQMLPRSLPQLMALDLAHNQLCDLEYSVESCKKLTNLKMLSLYGNPLVLMPQYFIYITDSLINLKYFDEQKFMDIKNRLLQAEKEKQDRILEIQRKQQEELELQTKLAADKAKKGGKGAVVQAPPPVITKQLTIEEPKINLSELRDFKITIKIQTLEFIEGILLSEFIELSQKNAQSKYWVILQFNGKQLKSNQILYETGTIDNELGRIDLDYVFEQNMVPEVSIRDALEQGILIKVFVEEPKLIINEEGDKKPILVDGIPEQEERLLGLCKISPDWLRGQNKILKRKYRLFKVDTAELWHPNKDEMEKIEQCKELIEKQIQIEQEEKKNQLQLIEQKKEQLKGKGKDVKKKDDKKVPKKGKDEVVQKIVNILDYELDQRQYVYVNEKTIHRASNMQLSVHLELGY